MYKVRSLDEFINESFFKNLSVGEYARIEAQLVEWSKQRYDSGYPRILSSSWTINNDLTIDVDGHVLLCKLDFEKLPVKFGKVTGYFSVYKCKNLTTLNGCPEEVGGLGCSHCSKLTSLEGAPKKVGGDFFAKECGKKFTEAEVKKYSKVKGSIYV